MREVLGGLGDPPTTPFFSSIGIVENCMSSKYGSMIDVEDTWVGVPTNGVTNLNAWVVSTFRGKFQLNVTYSEAFYEKALIDNTINKAFEVLLGETGVQNSAAPSIKQYS